MFLENKELVYCSRHCCVCIKVHWLFLLDTFLTSAPISQLPLQLGKVMGLGISQTMWAEVVSAPPGLVHRNPSCSQRPCRSPTANVTTTRQRNPGSQISTWTMHLLMSHAHCEFYVRNKQTSIVFGPLHILECICFTVHNYLNKYICPDHRELIVPTAVAGV